MKLRFFFLISLFFLSLFSCKRVTEGVEQIHITELDQVYNVVWNLQYVQVDSQILDYYQGYLFTVVFENDTSVWGQRGNNIFPRGWYGSYVKRADSIKIFIHLILDKKNFGSFSLLTIVDRKWFKLDLENNNLTLTTYGQDTVLSFKSDYILPVKNRSFIKENMILTDSNDPNFQPLKDSEYLPVLTLSSERSYGLKAGNCEQGLCIGSFGKFNIGYQQKILFYPQYGYYYSGDSSFSRALYVLTKHIEAAREYSVSGSVLTLIYPDSSYYYKYKF